MRTLPKDIIKLILFKYLSPFDAINYINSDKIHYESLHNEKTKLKKSCYAEMNKKVLSKDIRIPRKHFGKDVVCICGVLMKRKNLHKHKTKRKCQLRNSLLFESIEITSHCQFCGIRILTWNDDSVVYHNGIDHMLTCAVINQNTRRIYWRIVNKNKDTTYFSTIYQCACSLYKKCINIFFLE